MSDEKRNISDINDQQTAEQQAFSEEIRRRLAEPGSGKPTLDEFKVMVYKDREKRRKKRNALVACIVAAFIVGYLTYDDLVPEVGADKNPKETIKTEDGVIIEDGGWGSSVEEGKQLIITERKAAHNLKKTYPQLKEPQYVPEGYEFDQLTIEKVAGDDILAKYIFVNEEQDLLEIEIAHFESGTTTANVNDYDKKKNCTNGMIYFQAENKRAIIHFDDGNVGGIWHNVSEQEIIKIVEKTL